MRPGILLFVSFVLISTAHAQSGEPSDIGTGVARFGYTAPSRSWSERLSDWFAAKKPTAPDFDWSVIPSSLPATDNFEAIERAVSQMEDEASSMREWCTRELDPSAAMDAMREEVLLLKKTAEQLRDSPGLRDRASSRRRLRSESRK